MRRVQILIRYFDVQGRLLFEGEPNLRHAAFVPVQWVRWEIYWDGELVQTGERPPERNLAPDRRGIRPQNQPGGRRGNEDRQSAGPIHDIRPDQAKPEARTVAWQ